MRRHMYVRAILAVMFVIVGLISLNPLFLVLGGVFGYSAHSLWEKESGRRETHQEKEHGNRSDGEER